MCLHIRTYEHTGPQIVISEVTFTIDTRTQYRVQVISAKMNGIKILFTLLAMLKVSTSDCPKDQSPLVNPFGTVAENFNRSCHKLPKSSKWMQLQLNMQAAFVDLSFADAVKISIGPETCLSDKVFDLFVVAINKTYPNSTMEYRVIHRYLKTVLNEVGLGQTFHYALGSSVGLNQKWSKAMKKACNETEGSKKECEFLVPNVICLENSLTPQTVLQDVLVKLGESDPTCFTPPPTPLEILADNFGKNCPDQSGSEKLTSLIDNIALGYKQLTIDDVVKIFENPSENIKSKIRGIIFNAIDITDAINELENKVLKEYFTNVIDNVDLRQSFLTVSGEQGNSTGILQPQMEKACKKFPNDRNGCKELVKIVGCFEKSIPPKIFLTGLLMLAGYPNKLGDGMLGTLVNLLTTVFNSFIG